MSDINALKQLLDQRDKELALAASLGKDLLDRNRDLESRCDSLERLLANEKDAAAQLRHELSMKEELLVIYAMNEDRQQQAKQAASRSFSVESSTSLQLASLERKLHQLEAENSELRAAAAANAANDRHRWGQEMDQRETVLVKDCVRQLAESNLHIKGMADNLTQRTEMYMSQQAEITQLLARNVGLESKVKRVSMERDMQESRLKETQLTQRALTSELACLHDRYDECIALLDRSQQEAASLRRRLKSAIQRASSAAVTVASTVDSLPTNHHLLQVPNGQSQGAGSGGGGERAPNGAAASPGAPPPPYELSLMSELERSAGADSGLAGSLHYIRNVKSASATSGQNIRRRQLASSHAGHRSFSHSRSLHSQAAVSAENLHQCGKQHRPKSAGTVGTDARSSSLSGSHGDIDTALSNPTLNLDAVFSQSWKTLFRSISVGNLTSPLLESSSCFAAAKQSTTMGRERGASCQGSSNFEPRSDVAEGRQHSRVKCRRQSAVTQEFQDSSPPATAHHPARPTRLRRCRRRHHHSVEVINAGFCSSASSLTSLTLELDNNANDVAYVSLSSPEIEEDEPSSMATSTQTQTPGSSSQQEQSEFSQDQETPTRRYASTLGANLPGPLSNRMLQLPKRQHQHQRPRHNQQQQQQLHQQQQRLAWLGSHSYSYADGRRLQLVKPLSGSSTLAQWRRLATPGLHAAMAPRRLRGVTTRSGIGFGEGEADDDSDDFGAFSDAEWDDNLSQRNPSNSLMLASIQQPPQRATSLDAGINNCFLEVADTVKSGRHLAEFHQDGSFTREPKHLCNRNQLHRRRQFSMRRDTSNDIDDDENADSASTTTPTGEAGDDGEPGGNGHGWLLPTIGASILRGLLQLSLVTAGVENGSSFDSDDRTDTESSDFVAISSSATSRRDPRAGLNLFCPATGEVHSSETGSAPDSAVMHRVSNSQA